jgi:hypothetical protein
VEIEFGVEKLTAKMGACGTVSHVSVFDEQYETNGAQHA